MINLNKLLNQNNGSFEITVDHGAEATPQNTAIKSAASSGISSAPDGFEASPLTSNLFGLTGEQSERLVSNRPVTADPTVDPSMLFNYFTDIQKPAQPVPTEVGDQSLKPLGLPGDAIDKGEVALEDAVVTVGVATEDVGVAIGDAAEWVAGAVGDVKDEVDSVLNSVTDGKFGVVTKDIGNFAEARAWEVLGATEDVGVALGDAGEWFVDATGDAVGFVGDAGEWTVDAAEDIAEAAAKAAEDAAKAAAKAAADAAAAVAEAAEDVIDEVGEVLEDVGEAVGDVASDVGDFISDLW